MSVNERYRAALERRYADEATLYLHEKSVDADGIMRTQEREMGTFACRLSAVQAAGIARDVGHQDIDYNAKLFCAPEIDMGMGDRLMIRHEGMERTYEAGEAFVYETHQEVPLRRKQRA